MATAIGDLVIRLGAQTGACDRRLQGTRALMLKVKASAMGLLTALAPLGGAYLFAGMIRSGEQFERKMRGSLAIMGNVSNEMKAKMRETAFAVGRETSATATQAAESYYFLASAGMNAAQSIAALPAVAAFAQAGAFDMATATDLATDAQSALGMTSKDTQKNLEGLTRVTDVLIKANTLANASAEQFSTSLTTKAGAALRTVGKEIEEGAAVLAAWADQGIKGADAGTAMNIVLRDLQSKALLNRKAFQEAGVAVYDSGGEMRNLADIVEDLENRLEGCSAAEKKATLMQMGFGDKSVIFIQTLLGCSEKIREYERELRAAGGTCAEVADKQLTPLQKGLAELGSIGTELGTVIVEETVPAILLLFKGIGGIMNRLKGLIPWIVSLGAVLLTVKLAMWAATAATTAYALASKAAAAAQMILLALTGPGGWIKMAAAMTAAIAGILIMQDAMADFEGQVANTSSQVEDFTDETEKLGEQKAGVDGLTDSVQDLGDAIKRAGVIQHEVLSGFKKIRAEGESGAQALLQSTKLARQYVAQFKELEKARAAGTASPGAMVDWVPLQAPMLGEATTGLEQFIEKVEELSKKPGEIGRQSKELLKLCERLSMARSEAYRLACSLDDADSALEFDRGREKLAELNTQVEDLGLEAMGIWANLTGRSQELGDLFGGLEKAPAFLEKLLESLKTPGEKLDEFSEQLRGLKDLGLEIDEDQIARLFSNAEKEADRAMGGPKQMIRDLNDELNVLRGTATATDVAMRKLGEAGAFPGQIEEIRQLRGEIEKTAAGKELAERLRTPAEKAREAAERINELFAAGAIDEETRRRALEEQLAGLEGEGDGKGPGGVGAGAALAKGSAEAFHAILAAGRKDEPGKQTAKNTTAMKQDLNETKGMLREMLDREEDEIDIPA